jgi:hypothetical protein
MPGPLDKNKPRKISMTDREHLELKLYACAAGTSQGKLINQLVRGFANRVQRLRRDASLDPNNAVLASTCIQLLVLHDQGILSDQEFQTEIKELSSYNGETNWTSKKQLEDQVKAQREPSDGK